MSQLTVEALRFQSRAMPGRVVSLPAHPEAATLTLEAYESYPIERNRVRKRGWELTSELLGRSEAVNGPRDHQNTQRSQSAA